MRLLLFAMVLGCAACPAPPRHALSIEVRSGGLPVGSAVVALVCKPEGNAQLTDERGRVVFKMPEGRPLEECRLVAGKAGFGTVEAPPGRACATSEQCPAVALELAPQRSAAPGVAP
jgi:hypothetical protein